MAKAANTTTTPKANRKGTTAPAAAPTVPALPAPAANPFAALVASTTAPAAPTKAPLVHSLQVGTATLKAANHVATFKGSKAVAAGGTSYQLTGTAYAPAAGHVNATQWQAVTNAIAANGGTATVAQIAEQFTLLGLPAGLATAFVPYRAKGAKPNLQAVTA